MVLKHFQLSSTLKYTRQHHTMSCFNCLSHNCKNHQLNLDLIVVHLSRKEVNFRLLYFSLCREYVDILLAALLDLQLLHNLLLDNLSLLSSEELYLQDIQVYDILLKVPIEFLSIKRKESKGRKRQGLTFK
jgi:hypothetical protein